MAGDKEIFDELGLGLVNQIFPTPSRSGHAGTAPSAAVGKDLPTQRHQEAPCAAENKDPALAKQDAPPAQIEPVRVLGWEGLKERIAACKLCGLHESRKQAVPGAGNPGADLMLIGEAPGEKEDLKGEPFVGQAGQLLDQMLGALRISRKDVYVTNVVKCRPPKNRDPEDAETEACHAYLRRQVELVSPRLIVALGRVASQALLRTDRSLGNLRGETHQFEGVALLATYHPAYLLRNPGAKAEAWKDLCRATARLRQVAP